MAEERPRKRRKVYRHTPGDRIIYPILLTSAAWHDVESWPFSPICGGITKCDRARMGASYLRGD